MKKIEKDERNLIISVVLILVGIVGAIVCATMMFASVEYEFPAQPWLNGFGISCIVSFIGLGIEIISEG